MLKVKNLTFEVNEEGKKRCLVNHISFDVQDGEMLVITGPNGGGKSTLAKVLASESPSVLRDCDGEYPLWKTGCH